MEKSEPMTINQVGTILDMTNQGQTLQILTVDVVEEEEKGSDKSS